MRQEQTGRAADMTVPEATSWLAAAEAIEQLAHARTIDDVVGLLRASARRIVGADGIAVVLRDGAFCHYVAEDAKAPLWAGQRFPSESCVSGWAMRHKQTVAIPDVFLDPRVPVEAYRATFVRSMLMVPIGGAEPVAAVGAYWSETGMPGAAQAGLLEALARAASSGLESGRLFAALERLNGELERRVVERTEELERAQESLRQKQKMEVIGQITGNVAHDFNNLLSPIMASLDLVLGGRASAERLERSATVAMEAAETAKTLVQRLLAFARRQPLLPTAVDLAELVEGMRELVSSTIGGSGIGLKIDMEAGLPPVRADRQQLEMAILNLVLNARDAMPSGGTLEISALPCGSDPPEGLRSGAYVRLLVADDGCGMDAKIRASATEPFFTTKRAGQGTGLGLSMVEGLASQLGGALEIDSAPGAGTRVSLWLPVDEVAPGVEAEPKSDDTRDAGEACNLLLVDDEFLVRMGISAMLADLGYTVTEAGDARTALDLIEQGLRPDVVVTDHIMPGMTGAEFALRLRADHPEIAVMIISGYQGVDLIAPDIVRLSKPFRQAHLLASIAAARAQVRPTTH